MNKNPYAPPSSAVADIESGVPLERPKPVKIALILCWISLVLALPLMVEDILEEGAMFGSGESSSLNLAVTILYNAVVLVFIVWVIVSIGRARNWARIVYAVLTGLALIGATASISEMLALPWYSGPLGLFSTVMDAAIVVLLFLPQANAWFRMRGRRPAEGTT